MDKIFDDLDTALDGIILSDSPFDELDRVTDYYTAAIIKNLRRYPDSLTQDPSVVLDWLKRRDDSAMQNVLNALNAKAFRQPSHRHVMLYLQAHVTPGSKAHYMVGVRAQITRAWYTTETQGKSEGRTAVVDFLDKTAELPLGRAIHISRLHPSRTYDVEDVTFNEVLQDTVSLAGSVTAPLKAAGLPADFSLDVSKDTQLRAEAKRRFLSRIDKQGSFVDHDRLVFGWNFYPTNVEVVERSALDRFVSALFSTPGKYEVQSYLEAGGRDCAVFMSVPTNVTRLEIRTMHFSHGVDREDANRGEKNQDLFPGSEDNVEVRAGEIPQGERFVIDLPPYHPAESVVLWSGAGQSLPAAR